MTKSMVRLAALSLIVAIISSGCLDLFNVPGIALSPDGSTIVFLSGEASVMPDDDDQDEAAFDLARADLGTGETTVIAAGNEDTLISAFDINPTNGDIVYLSTSESSGTSLHLVGADGSTRQLLGADMLPGINVGTMMVFSPDGDKLAFTVVQLPPELTLEAAQDDDNELTPEQAKAIRFIAYVLDIRAGSLTPISSPDTERANALAWNPSSSRVAYNAWVDDNGDGMISTVPSMNMPGEDETLSDLTRISIFDLGTGTHTPINDSTLDFSPLFLSDERLAYISLDASNIASFPAINVYDLTSSATGTVYTPTMGGMLSLSLSPDGSQVAWIEAPDEVGDEELPSTLYVSGSDFASPRAVTTLPLEIELADTPIWTPDGNAVLISVTNVLATIPRQISLSFSTDGESSSETEGGLAAQVLRVDVDSGETSVVYSGPMINSSFFSGLFGLTTSGALDEMFGEIGED